MIIQERFKRLFRLRFAILYPLALFVIFFATVTDGSIRLGLGFILPGVFLRLWSNSYAVKTEKLTTCGPYAFLRNPLYLGTLLILFGVILLLRIYWVGGAAFAAFAFAYARTIGKEERLLEDMYQDVYLAYKKAVPSFIPRLTPYAGGEKWSFSLDRLLRSKEHKVFIWLAIAVIGFYLKQKIMIEGGAWTPALTALTAAAMILGGLDLVEEWWRRNKKRIVVT